MAIDQPLRRHFWAVTLGLTALGAFFGARGIAGLVGAMVVPDEKTLASGPVIAKSAPAPTEHTQHATSGEAILARNPFDSVTGPLNRAPIQDLGIPSPDLTDPENLPQCEGVKVLIIAASSDPEWSFAALTNGADPKSVLRRRGGEFAGKTVEFISWNKVIFKQAAQLCQIELLKTQPVAAQHVVEAQPPPTIPGGAPAVDQSISKGIVRVSANELSVRQAPRPAAPTREAAMRARRTDRAIGGGPKTTALRL